MVVSGDSACPAVFQDYRRATAVRSHPHGDVVSQLNHAVRSRQRWYHRPSLQAQHLARGLGLRDKCMQPSSLCQSCLIRQRSVLTCPPYLIAGIISILWSVSSGRFNERTWHITIAKTVAIAGFVLACATLSTAARYFAMVVFAIGTYAVNSIILGWVSATCGANKERKACSLAIVNTIANISFIWTPYLWPESDEPRYTIAMSSSAGFSIATATAAWVMKTWLMKLNKKIRQNDDETVLRYAY